MTTNIVITQCNHGVDLTVRACRLCDLQPDARDTRIAELTKALEDAATEIADWGAYASEYIRQKHGLDETVRAFRAIARDVGIDEVDTLLAKPGAG